MCWGDKEKTYEQSLHLEEAMSSNTAKMQKLCLKLKSNLLSGKAWVHSLTAKSMAMSKSWRGKNARPLMMNVWNQKNGEWISLSLRSIPHFWKEKEREIWGCRPRRWKQSFTRLWPSGEFAEKTKQPDFALWHVKAIFCRVFLLPPHRRIPRVSSAVLYYHGRYGYERPCETVTWRFSMNSMDRKTAGDVLPRFGQE